jgi:uncharacterized membrane protein
MPAAPTIGNTIAPTRFIAFLLLFAAGTALALRWLDWEVALMAGFDVGAAVFLASCLTLFFNRTHELRDLAARNDANRIVMLLISGLVAGVILVWSFANAIWTLHYAHLYYRPGDDDADCGGIEFPGTPKPDMADFTYFAFTIGVAAQTADVSISSRHVRRVVLVQSIAGFFFNLFVLALSINVLGAR